MKTYFVLCALAFLASFIGTPALRALCSCLGWLDSSIAAGAHERRHVPRLGGVVIYLALVGTFLTLFVHTNVITDHFRGELGALALLWGPATLVLLVGVLDDIRGMSAWKKLTGQLLAGVWLYFSGIQISQVSLPWGGDLALGAFALPVTLLWLVAITNAFNLIDGLDGLATGIAFISASAIAVTAIMNNSVMVVVITVALAGALLGFLRYNFSPATIFLGDSGSLFVGFLLASLAIVWMQKATTAIAVAAPLLAVVVPLADTALTVMRRYLRGQHLFKADRSHIHHRLLAVGLSPRKATLLLYGTALAGSLGCVLIARGHNLVTAAVVLSFVGLFGALGYRMYPEFNEWGRGLTRRRVLARVRLAEALESLQGAGSWAELCERLAEGSALLELDCLELDAGPRRRFSWRPKASANNGAARSPASLWRLSVPLPHRGSLVLGRRASSAAPDCPLELVAGELAPLLEEYLRGAVEVPAEVGAEPPARELVPAADSGL